jgi:hypothetical protein
MVLCCIPAVLSSVLPIAIIYDDNRRVWNNSSQRNVNVVAPFSPYIIRPSDDLTERIMVRGFG